MAVLAVAGRTAMRWTAWGRLLILAEVALTMKRHLDLLEQRERDELKRLVRKSKGRPSNLSRRERGRLGELVARLEPGDLAKQAARTAVMGRRPR